jgi:hypothetical protein
MKCQKCGKDCSDAYVDWHGNPYHVYCLPDNVRKAVAGTPPPPKADDKK